MHSRTTSACCWTASSRGVVESGTRPKRCIGARSPRIPTFIAARQGFGELLFHYNAMQGRSMDEARVEFERVVAGEPRHYVALWHLALIAAQEGRRDDVDSLTSRLLSLEPDAVRMLEVESLRYAALDDAPAFDRLLARLRDADESLLLGVGWRLAVYARRYDAADSVFRLLTSPGRGPHPRAIGYMQLLYLDLARGRPDSAASRLDSLGLVRRTAGGDWTALVAVMSPGGQRFIPLLRAWRDSLASITMVPEPHASMPARSHAYQLAVVGAMDAVLQNTGRALAIAEQLESPAPRGRSVAEMRYDGSRAAAIRALVARQAGRHEDVVRWTEHSQLYRWFGDGLVSPMLAFSIERFIRAESMLALGRRAEADAWFATIGAHDPSDLVFLPAALKYRTEIARR